MRYRSAELALSAGVLGLGVFAAVVTAQLPGEGGYAGIGPNFIPAVVSIPIIRNKTVLHILDGVKGLYHGGPGAQPQFVWEHKTMFFATDPVALDHIGWEELDAKRVAAGMKPVALDRPDKFSTFVSRQPEHVEIAGAMGLGEWEREKIDLKRIQLS